ncbi:MAG: GTP-binding protein [Propionicimonas sp.]
MREHTPLPLIVVTGVHAAATAAVTVGLQWDLPSAAVVRHQVDAESLAITRTVSDAGGVLEHEVIELEHFCLSCALRQDILPTVERLADRGRWRSIVIHLPLSAEAGHLCRMIDADPELRRKVRVAGVVAALRGGTVTDDLLGGTRLAEIGASLVPDDDRGVGEVLARQVEYADAVICVDGADQTAGELLTTLAQRGAGIHTGQFGPSGTELLASGHRTAGSEAWTATVRRGPLPAHTGRRVWQLDLQSDRPLHPDRFMAEIEALGHGRHRSRGCFWLASRPDQVCAWEGSGGHLTIGVVDEWQDQRPLSRLVITGDWSDLEVNELAVRFHRCVLTEEELAGCDWRVAEDGFEPWLGPIEPAAQPLWQRTDLP